MREIKFRLCLKELTKNGYREWFEYYTIGEIISGGAITTAEILSIDQYTGLKDKKGKEIYKGDIVEIQITHETKTSYKSQVWFNYDGACVELHPAHKSMGHEGYRRLSEYLFDNNDFSQSKCEVIGNIYENPELMEIK